MENKMDYTKEALNLYKPPFKFICGFIYDHNGEMVIDQVCRIRGWGRISYMENAEGIQDTVGDIVARALTEYWIAHKE